jgi:hypothetical protein
MVAGWWPGWDLDEPLGLRSSCVSPSIKTWLKRDLKARFFTTAIFGIFFVPPRHEGTPWRSVLGLISHPKGFFER